MPKPLLPNYLPLDETHPRKPLDPYGLSKVVGETVADSFARLHDIGICSLRFQDPGVKLGRLWSYLDARDVAERALLIFFVPPAFMANPIALSS